MPARTRIRYGPREQRERERGDELEHFYHKSQQLGSTHSIFSKTLGGAAAALTRPARWAAVRERPVGGGSERLKSGEKGEKSIARVRDAASPLVE